jgi:hypothetical protein
MSVSKFRYQVGNESSSFIAPTDDLPNTPAGIRYTFPAQSCLWKGYSEMCSETTLALTTNTIAFTMKVQTL